MNWIKWAIVAMVWWLLAGGLFGCAGLDAAIERASIDNPGVIVVFHADFALEVKGSGISAAGKGTIKDPGEGEPEEGEGDGDEN